jgi:hypothetical protein
MILEESNEVTVDDKLIGKYSKALKNAAFLTVLGSDFDASDVVACFAVEANSKAPRVGVLKHLAKQYSALNSASVDAYLSKVEVVRGRRPIEDKPAPKRRGRPPKNGLTATA